MKVGLLTILLMLSTVHCSDDGAVVLDGGNVDVTTDSVSVDILQSCEGASNGAGCDDGNPCSLDDTCQGGICVGGINKTCDSENPCEVGVCDGLSGNCTFTQLEDGSPCSIACFEVSTCQEGLCAVDPDTELDCSAEFEEAKVSNPCLEDLRCSQTTGECNEEIFHPSGTSCDTDSNLCTVELCAVDGECSGTNEVVSCTNEVAANPCSTYACDPKTGDCKSTGFAGAISCDDKNACTTADTCSEDDFGFFLCKGSPLVVDDANPCTDDQCKQGTVTHTPIPGLPCEAKTNCSDAWLCSVGGACEPGLPNANCAKGVACAAPYCDLVSGGCVQNVDAAFCILDDTCVPDGQKNPDNPCEVCDASATQIAWSFAEEGVDCNDGDSCTQNDACNGAGQCIAGPTKECAGEVCATEACDPATGACAVVDVDEGFCLIDGACVDQGTPSEDSVCWRCDPALEVSGWSPTPKDTLTLCGDDDPCNGEETCDGQGECAAGPPIECDDGNECTSDECLPESGACKHQPEPECPMVVPPVTDKNLNGVWGDGTGKIWVVGDDGLVLMGTEDQWLVVQTPACMASHDLLAVDGIPGGDMWVGANEESLMRFDGTTFHCADANGKAYLVQPGPNDHRVHKVWTEAPDQVLAFRYLKEAAGYLLHIFQLVDGNWKNIAMAAGFNASGIQARPVVPCASDNVFVSTFTNPNLGQTNAKIQRFTGTANLTLLNPIQDPADPVREMRDGVCFSPSDVHMAGHVGQVTHWNGSGLSHTNLYQALDEADRPTFWGMDGDAVHGLVVVGDNGSVARKKDGVWGELANVTPERLNDVWLASDGTAWAVGDNGTILRIEAAAP